MDYQIFAIGDSITYGKKDARGGWADRLKIALLGLPSKNQEFSAMIYNLGISGDTSNSLLSRFTHEVLPRKAVYPNRFGIALCAFGANDASFNNHSNKFSVPLDEYRQNILNTIELARKHEVLVVLINVTPVLPSIENSIDKYGKFRNNDFVNQFNLEISHISEQERLPLIDINSAFRNSKFELVQLLDKDGLHPSSLGHELIGDTVYNQLQGIFLEAN